jgi:hypothetical protein
MSHQTYNIEFTSSTPEGWDAVLRADKLKRQIALSALAHCDLTQEAFGLYDSPTEIREVHLTTAAFDQIRVMWDGHRQLGRTSPPSVPLKVFVSAFGHQAGHTWASLEVLPGTDNWGE